MNLRVGRGPSGSPAPRVRRLSIVAVASTVVLGLGMFALTRNANARDQQRLLSAEAQDARTTITALMSQIESTMSSVGSVAAATDGNQAAINRLATADPSLDLVAALAVLHRSPGGTIVVAGRGTPSVALPTLRGSAGARLNDVVALFGHGVHRRLAVAEARPWFRVGTWCTARFPCPKAPSSRAISRSSSSRCIPVPRRRRLPCSPPPGRCR